MFSALVEALPVPAVAITENAARPNVLLRPHWPQLGPREIRHLYRAARRRPQSCQLQTLTGDQLEIALVKVAAYGLVVGVARPSAPEVYVVAEDHPELDVRAADRVMIRRGHRRPHVLVRELDPGAVALLLARDSRQSV